MNVLARSISVEEKRRGTRLKRSSARLLLAWSASFGSWRVATSSAASGSSLSCGVVWILTIGPAAAQGNLRWPKTDVVAPYPFLFGFVTKVFLCHDPWLQAGGSTASVALPLSVLRCQSL